MTLSNKRKVVKECDKKLAESFDLSIGTTIDLENAPPRARAFSLVIKHAKAF